MYQKQTKAIEHQKRKFIQDSTPSIPHSIVSNITDSIHLLSIKGIFLYSSPCSKNIFDYSPDEMIGRDLKDFIHPSDMMYVLREMRECTSTAPFTISCRLKRRAAGYVFVELFGRLYTNEHRRIKCYVVTSRLKPSATLSTHNTLCPSPMSADTWIKISPEGLILVTDARFQYFFGFQALPCTLQALLHPDDQFSFIDTLTSLNSTLVYQDVVCRIPNQSSWTSVVIRFHNLEPNSSLNIVMCQILPFEVQMSQDGSLISGQPCQTMTHFAPLYENGDLLDVLTANKSSNIHYELNQLRIRNKKLREFLEFEQLSI